MADTIADRNVYILGAGASAHAGAPLIKNFLDYSRELFDQPFSGLEDFEMNHFQTVFEFRSAMAQAREKFSWTWMISKNYSALSRFRVDFGTLRLKRGIARSI